MNKNEFVFFLTAEFEYQFDDDKTTERHYKEFYDVYSDLIDMEKFCRFLEINANYEKFAVEEYFYKFQKTKKLFNNIIKD